MLRRTRFKVSKRTKRRRASVRELDQLCRALVFARDQQCVRCGSTEKGQWAHVYTRRLLALRWDLDNSMILCAGCHLHWHHRPLEAVTWWAEQYPERAVRLRSKAQVMTRPPP